MKKYYHTFLIPLVITNLLAETITVFGKIIDSKTQQPISNVNVFHHQEGTSSNELGQFNLVLANKSDLVTFKHVGYEEVSIKAMDIGEIIYLNPITLPAKEVYVQSGLREISLLESASSVTIIGYSELTNEPTGHFQGLIHAIPNLNSAGGTSRPRYFQIRGVGERSLYTGEGPPNFSVGFVIDDIDLTGIGMPGNLFDIQQVEVLRGPQSSIFGANAMAGLINMRSVEPKTKFGGSIHTTLATDNSRQFAFSLNTPITEKLQSRFSIFSGIEDGFRKNQYKNITNSNAKNEIFVKNKTRWVPSSLLQFDLSALYSRQNNKYDAWAPDNNEELKTYSNNEGMDSQNTTALSLRTKLPTLSGMELLSITCYSNAEMEHSYDGDWGNPEYWAGEPYNYPIDSIAAYIDNQEFYTIEACSDDYEGDKYCYYPYDYYDKTDRIRITATEEIRIYKEFSNHSSGIAGVYTKFLKESDDASGYLFGGDVSKYDGNFDIINMAGYLQYEQKLNHSFTLSLNTRFESNNIKYSAESNYYGNNDTTISFKTEDALVGFKSELKYKFFANSMMYIAMSRGYKAGGINQNPYLSLLNRSYQPEYNLNYELGFKTVSQNMQSQLTLFYMNRENQQVNISSQQEEGNPSSFFFFTANAASGYNFGTEFEYSYYITDNFEVFYNVGYLNTWVDPYEFKTDSITTQILGDRELSYAPKTSYSYGINYKYLSGITLGIEVTGRDKFYFSDSHNQISDKYELVNVNIGYDMNPFNILIWGKNILDTRYAVRGFYFGLEPPNYEDKLFVHWGDPAQYGVSLKYYF